jgi:hypothetical protein
VDVIPVRGREELRGHAFDLRRKDVLQAVVERLGVVALAAEAERGRNPGLGEEFVFFGNQFGQNLLARLHRNDVGECADPDFSLIAGLSDSLYPANLKKFRVYRPLIKAEKKLFNSLFGLSSFHAILWLQKNLGSRGTLYGSPAAIPRIYCSLHNFLRIEGVSL